MHACAEAQPVGRIAVLSRQQHSAACVWKSIPMRPYVALPNQLVHSLNDTQACAKFPAGESAL